jgi:ankyrin repeat protein
MSGNGRITQALIDAGADMNQRDRAGMTPLARACYKGHVSVVQALIEAGADVDPTDENGSTPLIGASSIGNELLVEALIQSGANVNAKDNVSERSIALRLILMSLLCLFQTHRLDARL